MQNTTNNHSISEPEALFITFYSTFSVITGLAGNLLVFLASTNYTNKSFNVDIVTVQFIMQLSLTDLLYGVTTSVPWMVTAYARGWVFGEEVCYVAGMMFTVCRVASIWFLLAVSGHRLCRCVVPLRVPWLNKKRACILIAMIWGLASIIPLVFIARGRDIIYHPEVTFCIPSGISSSESEKSARKFFFIIGIPVVSILMTNIGILIQVKRSTHRINLVAIKTVCSICGICLIGWTFPFVRYVLTFVPSTDFTIFYRIGRYLFAFTTLSNPILYTMTNIRFKLFVIQKIRICCCMKREQIAVVLVAVPVVAVVAETVLDPVKLLSVIAVPVLDPVKLVSVVAVPVLDPVKLLSVVANGVLEPVKLLTVIAVPVVRQVKSFFPPINSYSRYLSGRK